MSIAVVKWWKSGFVRSRRLSSNILNIKFWTSSRQCGSPSKSLKVSFILTCFTFSSSKSVLFKKRIIETHEKVLLLIIVSKMSQDSTSLFVFLSSCRTWSNSLEDARNKMAVIPSKHWNHFWRCDLWPPTSTKRNGMRLMSIWCSVMPFVAFLAWRMSRLMGT